MNRFLNRRTALIAVFCSGAFGLFMQRISPHYDPMAAAHQAATTFVLLGPILVFGVLLRFFFGWHRRFHRRMTKGFYGPRRNG